MSEPLQIWVRNDKGKVWGPLMPATLELLFDHGLIPGKIQVSADGNNFVYPARMPEVRESIPPELWGEGGPPVTVAGPSLTPVPQAASKMPGGRPPTLGGSGVPAPGSGPPKLRPPTLGGAGVPAPALHPAEGPATPVPAAAPIAGPGAAAAAQARAAAARAAPPVRAADRRPLPPDLGAPAPAAPPAAPAPAAVAAVTLPSLDIPPQGSIDAVSPLRLYYLAASTDANGLLSLTLSDRTVQIHFRKGNPEFVDSTHAEDQLSTFLVKNQLANFEQLGKAEKEKARFGGELIGALFGLGILNPGTAFQNLAQRAAAILIRGLFADHGTFTWELKDLPSHKSMPLGNRWAVVSEQLRKLPGTELRRRLHDAIDLPVMKSGGQVAVADLRLTPQETRALSYFDGVRSLNQLIHDLPNEADHILRVAFLLREFDAVAFASVRNPPPAVDAAPPPPLVDATVSTPTPVPAAAPVAAAARPASVPGPPPRLGAPVSAPRPPPPRVTAAQANAAPAPAAAPARAPGPPSRPVAPAAAPLDAEAELKQLTAVFEKMKTQNHFDVLGLKDTADAAAVKVAYFKFARAYHPDTVPPGAPAAIGKLKEEIFGRVGEANRTLSDDKLRAEYVEEVKAGNAGEKVDIAQILAAEELFQKGTILVKARKFPEAVKMLDDAIKAADESEYYAWRGYAKFFTFPDKRLGQIEAMKDIAVCLKRNDKIAAVWYFQGHMAKLVGDLPAAKKCFNKCVQLSPDHLDAQRELRMMK